MKYIYLILALLIFSSCKLTREQRKLNRKSKKIERIAQKYDLKTIDTATAVVQYITEPIKIDTIIELETDTVFLDTLSIIRIFPPKEFVYEEDGVSVLLSRVDDFELWRYDLSVEVVPDTIIKEVKVPFETIQPKEYVPVPIKLSKFQGWMLKLGNGMFWLLIAIIIALLGRLVIKYYTGK